MRLNHYVYMLYMCIPMQPAHNVVLRLILGCDVEQPIFNVETTLLIPMSQNNLFSTSDFNFETTSGFNVETTSGFNVETTSDFNVETTSDFQH